MRTLIFLDGVFSIPDDLKMIGVTDQLSVLIV